MRASRRLIAGAIGLLVSTTGCQLNEALADGVYGGVSDTIAAIISSVLLGLLGA